LEVICVSADHSAEVKHSDPPRLRTAAAAATTTTSRTTTTTTTMMTRSSTGSADGGGLLTAPPMRCSSPALAPRRACTTKSSQLVVFQNLRVLLFSFSNQISFFGVRHDSEFLRESSNYFLAFLFEGGSFSFLVSLLTISLC
jgi:hypothetical protein